MTKKSGKGIEVNPPEIKGLIRKTVAQTLRVAGRREREEKSRAITKKLLSLPEFLSSSSILFYASKEGEVDTLNAISKSMKMGKRVIVPVVKGDRLLLSYISSTKDLSPGTYHIPEPKKLMPAKPKDVELAIVPGIAFDKTGNRLGRGYAYFDKLLKVLHAPKIALAFDFQIVGSIPSEKHDIPVDKIITENEVITTSRTGKR